MTPFSRGRRRFLRDLGAGAAAIPFLAGLPGLRAQDAPARRRRLVIVFTPNGTLPDEFWPDETGPDKPLALKPMLSALEPFRERILMLKGVHNRVRGDGDNHMRGMSCLLTGIELSPGNIQGGSDSPAGWPRGISIDQEIRNHLQSREETRTRFGSLEFGVAVPERADPWTRMCYAGADRPVAPENDPRRMFAKLYGGARARGDVASVLDGIQRDLRRVAGALGAEDRRLLARHEENVRQMEKDIAAAEKQGALVHPPPAVDPEIELVNDRTPDVSRMQIDLLVNALANDMARVASLQYMRSVGSARLTWLGIQDGHHGLSHEPDANADAQDKLRRINAWFAGELAYLAKRMDEIPEPGEGGGTLLDHTLIVWVNELGKGNNHTLDNIPFLLLGGGAGFRMNRCLGLDAPHNRLWLAVAHAMGHEELKTFGAERFCAKGPVELA